MNCRFMDSVGGWSPPYLTRISAAAEYLLYGVWTQKSPPFEITCCFTTSIIIVLLALKLAFRANSKTKTVTGTSN